MENSGEFLLNFSKVNPKVGNAEFCISPAGEYVVGALGVLHFGLVYLILSNCLPT